MSVFGLSCPGAVPVWAASTGVFTLFLWAAAELRHGVMQLHLSVYARGTQIQTLKGHKDFFSMTQRSK